MIQEQEIKEIEEIRLRTREVEQFWFTISKVKDSSSYKFKLDNKTFKIGVEVFHRVLWIYVRLPNKEFVETSSHDEMVTFIKSLGYKDKQVYGKTIPDVKVSKEITETMTYKTYLAFSTRKAIPRKARKGTKVVITPKKKSSFTDDDNIVFNPDVSLELGKFISQTKAEEQEAARLVHETHKQLVIENPASEQQSDKSESVLVNRTTGKRRQSGIVFRAPLLDVLAFVVPPTSTTPIPPPLTTSLPPPITSETSPSIHEVPATPFPDFEAFTVVQQKSSELEKDVEELKQVDHSEVILATIKTHVPSVKDVSKIIQAKQEQVSKEQRPSQSSKPYDQAVEAEFK
uniref:Uncharacterized protein n=1 Tax=Tanacetum cinerariifolium TaxID=118510 RepID=A0A6L2NND7_TANCI|nr:hypothetical protein [Tanacetum cinerariifolium]